MVEPLTWKYTAESVSGDNVRGKLVATSQSHALQKLRDLKLKPIDISPVKVEALTRFISPSTRLSPKDQAIIVRSMSDLLGAGVPLSETLSILEAREKQGNVKSFLQRLHQEIKNGSRFSDALKKDPTQLSRLMIAMTQAGEATGTLDKQLNRFAQAQEKTQTLRRDITGQILYPLVLCLLVMITILFLSFFVLPEFETIFSDGEVRVPPETRFILDAGAWIRKWGSVLPLVIAGFLLVGQFIGRHYRTFLEGVILKTPIIGTFFMTLESGKFCRGLGVMLEGGMPIVSALEIARNAMGFNILRSRHLHAAESVKAGATLSRSLLNEKSLHNESLRFIELGERTGKMGMMVSKAADICEDNVKISLKRFTDLLSPILTILMGLITAGVIGSVMSGVLSLNETVY